MINAISVSTLICEKADDNSIVNILNDVILKGNNLVDFSIVLSINVYCDAENKPEDYKIIVYLRESKERFKVSKLYSVDIETSELINSTDRHAHHHRQIINAVNSYFPSKGKYILDVFALSKMEYEDQCMSLSSFELYNYLSTKNKGIDFLIFEVI